jgi:hypothetical protein
MVGAENQMRGISLGKRLEKPWNRTTLNNGTRSMPLLVVGKKPDGRWENPVKLFLSNHQNP